VRCNSSYLGYQTPSLPALRARLEQEQAALLADGIHLIVVQGADGSLVVGDSHHYADAPDPFQPREVDDRILQEFAAVIKIFQKAPQRTLAARHQVTKAVQSLA
jgi:D-hydroxyproline dehydrogenase subunit beta